GQKLPLLGDALAQNPVAHVIDDFRANFLRPLANQIRENNLNIDGLENLIRGAIFTAFGPGSSLKILLKLDGTPGSMADLNVDDYVKFDFYDNAGLSTNLFQATRAQFNFRLGTQFNWSPDHPLALDVGIPALGLDASFTPQFTVDVGERVGFGVDLAKGFYLVTDNKAPCTTDNHAPWLPGNPDLGPEITLKMSARLTAVDCSAGGAPTGAAADANGQLLFLALHLVDGVDLNGNGQVRASCVGGSTAGVAPQSEEYSVVYFGGSIDFVDPTASGANHDGLLTMPELISGSPLSIFQISLTGGALLRANATIDFSTLGGDFANILPKVTAKILIDFAIKWEPGKPVSIAPPQVVIADITLDLGSFISKFAGPILDKIAAILDPLSWLIGPDGFLNKRIPLLSDLAGHTITGKDLIILFDPTDGPKIVAFLDFVDQLYSLTQLVKQAAGEGNVGINFGDLVLVENTMQRCATPTSSGCVVDLRKLSFIDNRLNIGGSDLGAPNGSGGDSTPDIRKIGNFGNLGNALQHLALPSAATEGTPGSSTSSFTAGVTKPGSIKFNLLEPSTIFKLILGQPATIVTIQLPEFGFNFLYRQQFPIIGPLVGTFAGGLGGTINLAFGYDTAGFSAFASTHNAASLLKGFFIYAGDPTTGADRPEATLHAEIAVGAALSLAVVTVGVEGGISADIFFNLSDLDHDGKVRLDELGSNVLANGGNPLAVFDISGILQFFLRAYFTLDLGFFSITKTFEFARLTLLKFDIPFTRPAFLGTQTGGEVTLAIGPNSKNRLQGNLDDIAESINVESDGSGTIKVWSSQFGRDHGNAQVFTGVTKLTIDGGLGDDMIDLHGIDDANLVVEVHGGDGNDTIIGPTHSKCSAGLCAKLFGDGGNDHLTGGADGDFIDGGAGDDTIDGGAGNDVIFGGDGADTILGGPGADLIDGGTGNDTISAGGDPNDVYFAGTAGSTVTISGPNTVIDFCNVSPSACEMQPLTVWAKDGKLLIGWGSQLGTSSLIAGVNDYEHMVYAANIGDVAKVIGGKGADVFNIFQTSSSLLTLDGSKGNDVFNFLNFGNGSQINAKVAEGGDPWNLDNQIVLEGTNGPDSIWVTGDGSAYRLCSTSGCSLGSPNQVVEYVPPAALDAPALRVVVHGNGGNDSITVDHTAATVPVRVEGGTGSDIVTIGGTGSAGLTDIKELSRPGLAPPTGLGPIVVVGSPRDGGGNFVDPGSFDTLVVNASGDTTGRSGFVTAFLEDRAGSSSPVEVGVVGGFGMTMFKDALSMPSSGGAGWVEFEGMEAVDVRLGSGADTLTVGGEGTLLGDASGSSPQSHLPQTRQEHIESFVHTPAAMTTVSAGDGADAFQLISTNRLDREIAKIDDEELR
ncbi:MAG: calcium-binding protein, partial [Actinomycetota bacterium]